MMPTFSDRVTVQDFITNLEITIATKKNWFLIVFLCIWLLGWLVGEIAALGSLLGLLADVDGKRIFLFIWFVAWSVGGLMALAAVWWNLFGKEIITIGQGTLTITKKGVPFLKPASYTLASIQKMRVQPEQLFTRNDARSRQRGFWLGGSICFAYDSQTVRFGQNLSDADALAILSLFSEKHLLSSQQFDTTESTEED
ncbi:MAG: hypothetical protein U0Y10_10425 [Spirosomataceae bacterium]